MLSAPDQGAAAIGARGRPGRGPRPQSQLWVCSCGGAEGRTRRPPTHSSVQSWLAAPSQACPQGHLAAPSSTKAENLCPRPWTPPAPTVQGPDSHLCRVLTHSPPRPLSKVLPPSPTSPGPGSLAGDRGHPVAGSLLSASCVGGFGRALLQAGPVSDLGIWTDWLLSGVCCPSLDVLFRGHRLTGSWPAEFGQGDGGDGKLWNGNGQSQGAMAAVFRAGEPAPPLTSGGSHRDCRTSALTQSCPCPGGRLPTARTGAQGLGSQGGGGMAAFLGEWACLGHVTEIPVLGSN